MKSVMDTLAIISCGVYMKICESILESHAPNIPISAVSITDTSIVIKAKYEVMPHCHILLRLLFTGIHMHAMQASRGIAIMYAAIELSNWKP